MVTKQAWAVGWVLLGVHVLLGAGCVSTAASEVPRRNTHFEQNWVDEEPTSHDKVRRGTHGQVILASATSSSAASSQVPLTTLRLRAVAVAQGIGTGLTGIAFNRAVGLAFEHWILSSLATPRNTRAFISPARAAATGGLPASVIPEAALPIVWVKWGFVPTTFPDSLLCEVKAVRGAITLSHSRHQLRGLVDVASRSPAALASNPHRPIVAFITTGDTVIGADVLAEATRQGVAVWQAVVLEDSAAMNPSLSIGPFVPLNPSVYPPGSLVLPRTKAHVPGTLTSPLVPPVLVPLDPDPTEVGP